MEQPVRLQPITAIQAVARARQEIIKERSGEQLGLVTRFPKLNIAMRKYLRFNNVNLIAGLSGSGKSYLLNILTEDFLDIGPQGINTGLNFIPIVAHFCFEMSSYNEVLRACANDLGMSYNYLLSSEYDKKSKTYNRLTDEELMRVEEWMEYYSNKNILFYEVSGNMIHIYNTVLYLFQSYNKANTAKEAIKNKTFKYRLIVNIDHTLLIENMGEKSALDLMANVGKYSILMRKQFEAMINLIGQLNNNIEDSTRLLNPALQYPKKSDIYAQGQLYNACDTVFVFHQPMLLQLAQYGPKKRDTNGLMHLLVLKARHGNVGSIWFLNKLGKGGIVPYPEQDNTVIDDENLEQL